MGASVVLENLSKRFSRTTEPSLVDLSLTIESGETVCLVGPSGCGKSTTLRLIAGLDRPDTGRITIDGRDMTSVPPQARDVAMVFQGFSLYPHMTVRRNLSFPLEMRKVPRGERDRVVAEAAELLGMTRLLDRRPAELSGGERQRVAMGRALVRRPKVFLFDEPLSNLDAALRTQLRGELGRLLRRLNATALYVTHDQAEAMTLGRRVALLRKGHLVQLDTPHALYAKPTTSFSASFFGAPPMNLIGLSSSENRVQLGGMPLRAPPGERSHVVLGIRPEHLRLSSDPQPGSFSARVIGLEPLGAETHVDIQVENTTLRARCTGFVPFEIGAPVQVAFDAKDVHWFDAETERVL